MNDTTDDLAYNPAEGGDFEKEKASPGLHNAVCAQIHNLGHQLYEGRPSLNPKVAFIFELDEKMKGGDLAGKPMVLSRTFAYYLGENAGLRLFLQNWAGKQIPEEKIKGMTLRNWVGVPCSILVAHELNKRGVMKAVIKSISPRLPDNPKLPVTYTETPKWVLDDKAKAVQPPPPKNGTAGAQPQGVQGNQPPPEDDLPF